MPDDENELKVTDKRKFDKDGNVKEHKKTAVKNPKEKKEADKKDEKKLEEPKVSYDPQKSMDFIQFILSLYTSVLATLGEINDPSAKIEKNSEHAKEIIDILSMLQEKTKGNLTTEEQNVIDEVVYQSKIIFLKNTGGLKV